jgi:hypothetical protein
MEALLAFLTTNWPAIVTAFLALLASVDKIGLMFFKTLRNLVDYYRESFPKDE